MKATFVILVRSVPNLGPVDQPNTCVEDTTPIADPHGKDHVCYPVFCPFVSGRGLAQRSSRQRHVLPMTSWQVIMSIHSQGKRDPWYRRSWDISDARGRWAVDL
jgi:hypothetical protein